MSPVTVGAFLEAGHAFPPNTGGPAEDAGEQRATAAQGVLIYLLVIWLAVLPPGTSHAATYDAHGYPKHFALRRGTGGIEMILEHNIPEEPGRSWHVP